jgi:pyridoxamine 5'-phosphate oxidase
MSVDIGQWRDDYGNKDLPFPLEANPINQFSIWLEEAIGQGVTEANAATLATAAIDSSIPSARIVLIKEVSKDGFIFFTQTGSRKGCEIDANPEVALVFFWQSIHRQVCINGLAEKISVEQTEQYFKSRPRGSQLAAWTSHQGKPIESRGSLFFEYEKIENKFKGEPIPPPPNWSGYLIKPYRIEFWQGHRDRLHDRIQYLLQNNQKWIQQRISP